MPNRDIIYSVHFESGKRIKLKNEACFSTLPYLEGYAKSSLKLDIANEKVKSIRFYFQNQVLNSASAHNYIDYLVCKFNKYLITDDMEDILNSGYVEISADTPVSLAIGILSFFRYIEEDKTRVETFFILDKLYPHVDSLQRDVLFIISEFLQLTGYPSITRKIIYRHDIVHGADSMGRNHGIFGRKTATYDALYHWNNDEFKQLSGLLRDDLRYNFKVQDTFHAKREYNAPEAYKRTLLIPNSSSRNVISEIDNIFYRLKRQ